MTVVVLNYMLKSIPQIGQILPQNLAKIRVKFLVIFGIFGIQTRAKPPCRAPTEHEIDATGLKTQEWTPLGAY